MTGAHVGERKGEDEMAGFESALIGSTSLSKSNLHSRSYSSAHKLTVFLNSSVAALFTAEKQLESARKDQNPLLSKACANLDIFSAANLYAFSL